MKIEVYNLNKILRVAERCPGCNLLSIRDPDTDHADTVEKHACLDRRIARNGINAKVVYFHDIDPYRFHNGMEHPSVISQFVDGGTKPVFFNSDIAREIVDWAMAIWNNDHNDTIKIHCWAGRSRSQAVAYWLNVYFNLVIDTNLQAFLDNNELNVTEKVHFNCEVLRVFTDTFG